MITRQALDEYLRIFLECGKCRDYAPNGLQVEGRGRIRSVVTAVSASQAAVDYALAQQADALLVHHGYFWKGEDSTITGMKKRRLAALLAGDVNLFAYHLPLDQHPELGNNRLFADLLPFVRVWQSEKEPLLWHGECAPLSLPQVRQRLSAGLDFPCYGVGGEAAEITRIAWCTGAAQDLLQLAACEGAQVFCSGEYAERTWHEARETGCVYMVCGHHATERAGIRALGGHLAAKFGLSVRFFDEGNPF